MKIDGALYLNEKDTPATFVNKLKVFLESLRKWN